MKSLNPAFNHRTYRRVPRTYDDVMSVEGAVHKSLLLLFLVFVGATWSWSKVFWAWEPDLAYVESIAIWASFCAFFIGLVICFKVTWSPVLAPLYALVEGAAIGALSTLLELVFPGIVLQAVGLTFGVALVMLVAYQTRWIEATDKFKLAVTSATGAVCLIYLATFALGLADIPIPYIHESGWVGILFSVVFVVIAATNLVIDFDFIEKSPSQLLPKYMEWYSAFGLMVTLVWLYLEIIRLLAKTRSRE